MTRLTTKQKDLLNFVQKHPGLNTHQIAQWLGHYQAYESHLRDRLVRLMLKGLVKMEIQIKGSHVIERKWLPSTKEGASLC